MKLESNAGVLSSFDFFFLKSFLTWGNLMPEYQHISIQIFKPIWLILYLQDRKKILQRFYLTYWTTAVLLRAMAKLHVKKKKETELQHSFHTPTHPWGSSTSFLWLFLDVCVFFSRPATKDVLCHYWGLCMWLSLELFLESAITICIELVELLHEWKFQMAIFVFVWICTVMLQITFFVFL